MFSVDLRIDFLIFRRTTWSKLRSNYRPSEKVMFSVVSNSHYVRRGQGVSPLDREPLDRDLKSPATTAAAGTYPTGMHSCFPIITVKFNCIKMY